jgi:predicted  nucleic acid-binding Zn-ribbon protein
MNKFHFVGIVLILCMNTFSVYAQNAQESQYVCVKQEVVDKVISNLLAKQGDVDPVQKGWGENLLRTAFLNYFTNKASKAIVYDQSAWNELKDELSALNDSIKKRDANIKALQKQLSRENFENQMVQAKQAWEQERNQLVDKYSSVVKIKDATISDLGTRVKTLEQDSIKHEQEINGLKKSVDIAKNVTEQYNQKLQALDDLYKEYKNSQTLEYVKADLAQQTISEYSDYLKIIGIPMPTEQKTQIEFLKSVSNVGVLYQSAINIMNTKYDENAVKKWILSFKSISSNYLPKLNDGQRTVMARIENAMSSLGAANNHFRKSILVYLQEQGQIPDKDTAKEVKDMVQLKVRNYSEGKHIDTKKYNPYHTNLNRILSGILEGIKVMNETDYGTYISKIENTL